MSRIVVSDITEQKKLQANCPQRGETDEKPAIFLQNPGSRDIQELAQAGSLEQIYKILEILSLCGANTIQAYLGDIVVGSQTTAIK